MMDLSIHSVQSLEVEEIKEQKGYNTFTRRVTFTTMEGQTFSVCCFANKRDRLIAHIGVDAERYREGTEALKESRNGGS